MNFNKGGARETLESGNVNRKGGVRQVMGMGSEKCVVCVENNVPENNKKGTQRQTKGL